MANSRRVSFQRLTASELNKPIVIPLTKNEKQLMTARMGKPKHHAKFLEKRAALSMPNLEACHQRIEWYEAQGHDDQIALMIEENWIATYGEEAMRAMVRSMFFQGKPTAHWVFVFSFDYDTSNNQHESTNGTQTAASNA